MKKNFLVVTLVLFCVVCAAPGSLKAAEEQDIAVFKGMPGGQGLEGTKQSLKQALQSGALSREEYDIAMGDIARMENLSAGDQRQIQESLKRAKQQS